MSFSKEVLKAFLKRYGAEECWKAIGVTPAAVKGARKGSSLAGQIAITNLVEQLCRSSIAPEAFKIYENLWAEIVDRITDKAWSSPTRLKFDDPAAATALLTRVLEPSRSVSREQIEEILEVAPIGSGDCENLVTQLPSTEAIVARRSIDDIRVALARLEARLADALGRATSSADLEELRSKTNHSHEGVTAQLREMSSLLKERGVQISDLQTSVQRDVSAFSGVRELILEAVSEVAIIKQHNLDLLTRVGAAEEALAKAQAVTLTPSPTKASANAFPIKPLVKIVEQRGDLPASLAPIDHMRQMAVALRNAGLAKQSAETTAAVVSASLVASGWVNVSGSLSAHLAETLTAAAIARHCLVSIPVGCLEQIPKAPSEAAGMSTLWRILGFDRAPVQVVARYLKSFTVSKLITGSGYNFVIAIHEGGDICRNVLPDAAQLGAWIDTDALLWSGQLRREIAKPFSLTCFALNETKSDLDEDDHKIKTALGRLLEARFLGALGLFITDDAIKSILLERHIIAPHCAGDASVDPAKLLTDDQALQIALRLRVF